MIVAGNRMGLDECSLHRNLQKTDMSPESKKNGSDLKYNLGICKEREERHLLSNMAADGKHIN